MTGSKTIVGWAKNRAGLPTKPDELPYHTQDSIDQNRKGPDFTKTFGQKNFSGMVGFIDLKGFSTISAGKRAHEIADIVRPFLNSSISILTDNNCLIDKTIGDEIMFVLPQTETGWVAFFDLFKILRKFREFAADHEEYKFRIGISFGELFLDVIDTKNYVEWFVSGEPIIAAKRVMSMPFLSNPNPCIAAICQPVIRKSDLESFCKGIADFEPASWRKKGRTKTVVAKGIGKLSVQIMEPERT